MGDGLPAFQSRNADSQVCSASVVSRWHAVHVVAGISSLNGGIVISGSMGIIYIQQGAGHGSHVVEGGPGVVTDSSP